MAGSLRTALHIFANGWRETKIEGGINVAVTRLSLNIKRRISLYASIVRQVEYDLEDRKVRRWGQHDYSTDRPDADGAFGGVREADSCERTGTHTGPGRSDLGRCGDRSHPAYQSNSRAVPICVLFYLQGH